MSAMSSFASSASRHSSFNNNNYLLSSSINSASSSSSTRFTAGDHDVSPTAKYDRRTPQQRSSSSSSFNQTTKPNHRVSHRHDAYSNRKHANGYINREHQAGRRSYHHQQKQKQNNRDGPYHRSSRYSSSNNKPTTTMQRGREKMAFQQEWQNHHNAYRCKMDIMANKSNESFPVSLTNVGKHFPHSMYSYDYKNNISGFISTTNNAGDIVERTFSSSTRADSPTNSRTSETAATTQMVWTNHHRKFLPPTTSFVNLLQNTFENSINSIKQANAGYVYYSNSSSSRKRERDDATATSTPRNSSKQHDDHHNNDTSKSNVKVNKKKQDNAEDIMNIGVRLEYDPSQPQYSPSYDPDPFFVIDREYNPLFPSWND